MKTELKIFYKSCETHTDSFHLALSFLFPFFFSFPQLFHLFFLLRLTFLLSLSLPPFSIFFPSHLSLSMCSLFAFIFLPFPSCSLLPSPQLSLLHPPILPFSLLLLPSSCLSLFTFFTTLTSPHISFPLTSAFISSSPCLVPSTYTC